MRVPACVSPVATTRSSSPWDATRRSSSAPVKPDAPTIPTEGIARAYGVLNQYAIRTGGARPGRPWVERRSSREVPAGPDARMQMSDFMTDIEEIRRRARDHIEQGPITEAYGADR